MRLALARYPLARNTMTEPYVEDLDRASTKDPAQSTKDYVRWQRGPLAGTSMKTMQDWVDKAAARDNVWLVLVFHGVEGIGWEPKSKSELEEYFTYIKSQESKAWVATFQDVAKYMRERMSAHVTTHAIRGAIEVTVKHELDAKTYDLPLTLKTRVPSAWKWVQVEQRTKTTTCP